MSVNKARTANPAQASILISTEADDASSITSRHTLKTLAGKRSDSSFSVNFNQDDEADPWTALPSSNSRSPALPVILDPAEKKRMLLRAGGQLLALFLVCLVGLGGLLWLALPVIDDADRPAFKLPRSFEQLKELNAVLQHYKDENFAQVMLCWFILYMFLQAFSIPGSMYMSILAGALWGVPLALPLVCASVATGATICYLISRFLGVVLVALPSWQARINTWKEKLAEHNDNMLSYLIVIRMMPLPPHNVVNILAPHLGISIPMFWISTFFGIFAVSFIHTTIGEKLDEMTSADDFNLFGWRNVLLLSGVCLAVLIPVAVRKYSKVEALEEAPDASSHGPVHLADDEQDAAELPQSFSHRSLVGRRRTDMSDSGDDDDELPPIGGLRIDGMEDGDESFTAWRDTTHGSRIGEDNFASDDESPMFSDRNNHGDRRSGQGFPNPDRPQSMAGRMKTWLGNK